MSRTLRLLFRRQPSRDRVENGIPFEGYDIFWPDGRSVRTSLSAFCKHGQRLLGLGRHLAGASERMLDLIVFPLPSNDAALTRLQGHRVRRLSLRREGRKGRLYFFDGTPTTLTFDLDRDDPAVLQWIGLPRLHDGERQWLDMATRTVEASTPAPHMHTSAFGVHPLSQESLT